MPLPNYTYFEEAALIPKSVVDNVRMKFLEEVSKASHEYYPQDIERIKTNDWHITRFMIGKKTNVDDAIKAIIAANKWRKSFGVLELKTSDFPKEAFQCGGGFAYGTDINGSKVIINRGKTFKKIKPWIPTFERFCVFTWELIDREFDGKGITLLGDCRGVGIKNVYIEAIRFGLKVNREYYPGLIKAQLLYESPTILEPIYKTIQLFLISDEKNTIHFVNKNNINEYIAEEQLPNFLYGTNTQSYCVVPDDTLTAHQLAKTLGLKEGAAEQLVNYLTPFFID